MIKKIELVPIKGGSRIKPAVEIVLFLVSAIGYVAVLKPLGAAAVMAYIIIHEGGHMYAMEKVGIRPKGVYFIPFLGCLVTTENDPSYRKAEFYTAIMGPTMDLMLVPIVIGLYFATRSVVFPAVALFLALNDLLNLLPVLPFDGGLMLKSIAFSLSPKIKLLLIALGFLVSSLTCWTVALTEAWGISQVLLIGEIDLTRISPLLLVGYIVFCFLQSGWILLQALTLANEEKVGKIQMTKTEIVLHSAWYLLLVGTLLLIVICCFGLIMTNPKGLLDFMSLPI